VGCLYSLDYTTEMDSWTGLLESLKLLEKAFFSVGQKPIQPVTLPKVVPP